MHNFGRQLAKGGEHFKQHSARVERFHNILVEPGGPVFLVRPQEQMHRVVLNVCVRNHLYSDHGSACPRSLIHFYTSELIDKDGQDFLDIKRLY